jgi:E3 ubiquitin-protein ligase HUWE1
MAFEWNGEAVEPPLPMIISHRGHHRPRHGIPSPFGYITAGARDSLGGMFDPLPELHNLLEMESSAAAGIDHAQSALSRAQAEVEGGDHLTSALSTARSALQEARARLTALQGLVSGVVTIPTNFNTNAPSVPEVYRGFSPYRSHRPGPTPRGNDDGTNPLLQRSTGLNLSRDISFLPGPIGGPLAAIRAGDGLPNLNITATGSFSDGPAALLNDLITSLPLPGHLVARNGHQLHFQFTGGPRSEMTRDLQALFGMSRGGIPRLDGRREPIVEPGNAASFSIRSTAARWTDEAKLLFGNAHPEKAYHRVHNAVMAVLIPPAIKLELEARKVAEDMKKRREEEERLAKEAKEKRDAEEKAEKERLEAEEREAVERARAEEAAAAGAATSSDAIIEDSSEAATVQPMEGVEAVETNATPAATEEDVPPGDRPRVTTIIRGNQIDITDLGIDPDFLRELPEDLREEVITSTIAERRSQAAAGGAEPSEIDQEFLDALPAEIRDEIIQQERQDRRRREREEARRQNAASGAAAPAAGPQEMDAASILATLPAALRQQILMEQDEEILSQLGPEFIAQARAGGRDLPLSHVRNMAAGRPRTIAAVASGGEQSIQKPQRRTIVQMLDKAGVATLLRLMFVFQQDSLRSTLFQVLQNISENRHNRSEVISTLLHILQDGSTDMTAVERSFAHLSLRAKQPKDKEPKTPQPLKRTLTGMSLNIVPNTDVSPLMVVQQCLSTLIYLSKVNLHVPSFFLTEHDASGGLKRSASRKGKGKDTRASKYALNSLLTLLDRKLIMESSSVMESLSDLLSRVTAPLQALERKQKEAADEAKKTDTEVPVAATVTSESTPETAAINELQPELMETDGDAAPTAAASEPAAEAAAEANDAETNDAAAPIAEQSEKHTAADAKENEQKKQRPFVPPVIPEANLKLVINIFVARECSAKTFRETLSTIKNLSCIPGAKAVFGKELIRKAQELGDIILFDLVDLLPQIQKASSGTEIQGVALAKFSPSGSDQNKLLRVLTALDHLFDSKNTPRKDAPDGENAEATGDQSKEVEKQDLLATLYENPTFGPMWEKLSACLSAIRQREKMLNVATILLPLIESLMVVCKNTTLKDVPITRSQIGRELSITSPKPESRMENLFFTFTEEHRKILNDLVRHTPKLMSGTFSLLVKNPKVLEFDNKRNYFTRSIHNRNSQTRQSFPPLQLSVRREQVFHDSFKSLYFKSGDEMKFGKLSIRFHGEEGVDAGGVTREWFQVLSRQMFDPGYALFIPVSSDRTTFHPNHMSGVNPEHLSFFKFIGRVIGKALYEGRVLDCHFSRAVYKRILGKSVSVKDMESLDPEYYKSLVWMLENDITDIITETFSVDNDKFGVIETVDLIENGRNILVTQENKQEYIRLIVEFKLIGSVQEQLNEFLKGKSAASSLSCGC